MRNYIFVHVDFQQTKDFFTFTLKIFWMWT